jgi:hypothetical protein
VTTVRVHHKDREVAYLLDQRTKASVAERLRRERSGIVALCGWRIPVAVALGIRLIGHSLAA